MATVMSGIEFIQVKKYLNVYQTIKKIIIFADVTQFMKIKSVNQ